MKCALISDVHSNLPALEAVLEDIDGRQDIATVYQLGDMVGCGMWPNEVVGLIRGRHIQGVAGNCESAVVADGDVCDCRGATPSVGWMSSESLAWTRASLDLEHKFALASLPSRLYIRPFGGHTLGPTIVLFHGSPSSNTSGLPADSSESLFRSVIDEVGAARGDLVAFGHTHLPYHRKVDGVHFVNTGSVGKPKDGDTRAGYVVVDAQGVAPVEFVRVEYDLNKAARAIWNSTLPNE